MIKQFYSTEFLLRAIKAISLEEDSDSWTIEVLGWIPFQFGLKISKVIVLDDPLVERNGGKPLLDLFCVLVFSRP